MYVNLLAVPLVAHKVLGSPVTEVSNKYKDVVLSSNTNEASAGTEIVDPNALYVVPSANRNSTVASAALVPSMLAITIWFI